MSRFFCYACQCDKPEESKVRVSKAVTRCRSCLEAAADYKRTRIYAAVTSLYSTVPSDHYIVMEVEDRVDACILDAYREAHAD